MALFRELATLILLLFDLILFIILMLRTLTNMYAKGSRALLLMLLGILLMTSSFAAQAIVTRAETRIYLYFVGYFYFMLLPVSGWLMASELIEGFKKKYPRILVPIVILEIGAYIYMLTQVNSATPAFTFSSCEPLSFMTSCQFGFGPGLGWFMVAVLLPLTGAGVYLLMHYFEDKTAQDRSQILAVAIAILSVPVSNGVVVLLFGNEVALPMTISYLLLAVLFFNAVYNHKILAFKPMDEQRFAMIDDIMLIIDNDHIIQDFNLSTLNVFHLQVRNLVNVKMEHTFIDYPQIIDLFNQPASDEKIELLIDGLPHEFEPSLVSVIDPDTNKEIGKRLQLRDITEQSGESDTTSITRDRLTNQYTRETFFGLGNSIFANAKRMGYPIAIVVIDIDDFRMINSRYTWAVGDEGLVQMVDLIQETIRNTDLFARFDSDNFVLLLPRADEPLAYQVCTRIKDAIATHIFQYQGQEFSFTVSQAYSVYDGATESSLEGFYETARTALMQSRGQGRNRLVYKDLRRN